MTELSIKTHMEITVKHKGIMRLAKLFGDYYNKKIKAKLPEEEIVNIARMIRDITSKYNKYCTTIVKDFLEKKGWEQDLTIIVKWQERGSSEDIAFIEPQQIEEALESNIPSLQITVYGQQILHSQERGRISFSASLENVGRLMLSTLTHETVHLVQYITQSPVFKEISENEAANKLKLSQLIRLEVMDLLWFSEAVIEIYQDNEDFINFIKMEGEAEFTGEMYSHYAVSGKKGLEARRIKIDQYLQETISIAENELDQEIKELEKTKVMLEEAFKLLSKANELIFSFSLRKKKKEKLYELARNAFLDFSAIQGDLKRLSASKKKNGMIYSNQHALGFVVMYALTRSKQHRYDLLPRTFAQKFVESKRHEELNVVKNKLGVAMNLIDQTNNLISRFREIIPKKEKELNKFVEHLKRFSYLHEHN